MFPGVIVWWATGAMPRLSRIQHTFKFGSYVDGNGWTPKTLRGYEGKTIRIDGMLMPGDHLNGSITLVDEERRTELHDSKFN
jgi:hypothetical protein